MDLLQKLYALENSMSQLLTAKKKRKYHNLKLISIKCKKKSGTLFM